MNMKTTIALLACIITMTLISCSSQKTISNSEEKKINIAPPKGVLFTDSDRLKPLLAQAKEENKLVFIDFYASWCPPCNLMDEEVFSNEKMGDFMNAEFINYKVNTEKGNGPSLAGIFNVRVLPTLLFLHPSGKVLVRQEGAVFQRDLTRLAKDALANAEELNLPKQ